MFKRSLKFHFKNNGEILFTHSHFPKLIRSVKPIPFYIMDVLELIPCDICRKRKKLLVTLNQNEKLLTSKLFLTSNIPIPVKDLEVICQSCTEKLYSFKSLLRDLLFGHIKIDQLFQNMDKNDEQNNTKHDCNCQCNNCATKYGSLPLLVQVIEDQNMHGQTNQTTTFEPQPSSSRTEEHSSSFSVKKTMSCDYCSKIFTHKGDLNKHIRKHTKEQPYNCPMCSRKFAHTSNLSRHMLIHSGVQPFVCEVCNKAFNRKDKLESHKSSRYCKKL